MPNLLVTLYGSAAACGLALALLRCASGQPEVVTPPKERPDASPARCGDACARLAELGCESALPTPGPDRIPGTEDDGTCERVCKAVQASEATALDLGCVVAAASCEASEACGYGAEP